MPYPRGSTKKIPEYGVIGLVGLEAVLLEGVIDTELAIEARRQYAFKRPYLLKHHLGQWVAMSSNGNMLTASTMEEIYDRANKTFNQVTEDRCVYCVGSEYIEQIEM